MPTAVGAYDDDPLDGYPEEPACGRCADCGAVPVARVPRVATGWYWRRCPGCNPSRLTVARARLGNWLRRLRHPHTFTDDESPF